ncbi:hypothetical protein INT47_009964 [Mucor saturninus]|uniref:Reticulon-like protein n=1 Tax=Mucor saturninus TaxID=64648 RepID=A0A8H7QWE2_9FUNG|nr:hypothetical protein INT47_009964 [Mucor saturninus]
MTETANPYHLTMNKQLNHMAPPSPQLSQDDLVRGLKVLGSKPLTPSESTELPSPISPANVQKLDKSDEQDDEDMVMVDDEFQMENDVAMLIYFEFMDLIYWEIPGRTGIILMGILGSLVLTRYYSLLYVLAGSLTILTGFNLIFVNVYNFIRTVWTGLPTHELIHPYHLHMDAHRQKAIIPRDLIDYYIHKAVDVLEIVVQGTVKIVYVYDTKTTGFACILSACIYFATSLVPTKVFFGAFILCLFTVPYFYEQHQDTLDESLTTLLEKSKLLLEKYRTIVQTHSTTLYQQSVVLLQQKMQPKTTME